MSNMHYHDIYKVDDDISYHLMYNEDTIINSLSMYLDYWREGLSGYNWAEIAFEYETLA